MGTMGPLGNLGTTAPANVPRFLLDPSQAPQTSGLALQDVQDRPAGSLRPQSRDNALKGFRGDISPARFEHALLASFDTVPANELDATISLGAEPLVATFDTETPTTSTPNPAPVARVPVAQPPVTNVSDPNATPPATQLMPTSASGSAQPMPSAPAATVPPKPSPAQASSAATPASAPKAPPDLAARMQNARNAFQSFKKAGENVDGFNATSAAHDKKNPGSDHRRGLAFDWHVKGASNLARAMAIPGVRYVIHAHKIYYAKDGFKPHPYVGDFANGQPKDPHLNHIHVNF